MARAIRERQRHRRAHNVVIESTNTIIENWVSFSRTAVPEWQDPDGIPMPYVRLPPTAARPVVAAEHAGGVSVKEADPSIVLAGGEGNTRLKGPLERSKKQKAEVEEILRISQELEDSIRLLLE